MKLHTLVVLLSCGPEFQMSLAEPHPLPEAPSRQTIPALAFSSSSGLLRSSAGGPFLCLQSLGESCIGAFSRPGSLTVPALPHSLLLSPEPHFKDPGDHAGLVQKVQGDLPTKTS